MLVTKEILLSIPRHRTPFHPKQVELFERLFPQGLDTTPENLIYAYESGFDARLLYQLLPSELAGQFLAFGATLGNMAWSSSQFWTSRHVDWTDKRTAFYKGEGEALRQELEHDHAHWRKLVDSNSHTEMLCRLYHLSHLMRP